MLHKVKASPPPGGDRLEFVMSDGSVDRMGDVIEPAGWDLSTFKAGSKFNPIALFNHRSDYPVGSWSDVRVKGGQLVGRFVPAAPGTSEIADSVRKLVEQDILRAVSVGFEPIERELLNDKACSSARSSVFLPTLTRSRSRARSTSPPRPLRKFSASLHEILRR